VALEQVFVRVIEFPLPVIPATANTYRQSSGAGISCQIVADMPSGHYTPHPKELEQIREYLIQSKRPPL
jgi:hypothetical protein